MAINKIAMTVLLACGMCAGLVAAPIRIMPVGDSITYGQGWDPYGGYRAVLREKLVAAGYDVDYVGTQTGNQGTLATSGDVQHEGHLGWPVGSLTTEFPAWSAVVDAPHLILLKIGTNNCNGDHDEVMRQMGALLDEIKRLQPSAHVICGTLVTFLNGSEIGSNDAWVQEHNRRLTAEVASRAAAGDRISLADLYSVVHTVDTMNDERHPNEAGYRAMAEVWFDAITAVFPDPAATPEEPALTAVGCTIDDATGDSFTIRFNTSVGDSAAVLDNYSFGGAFTPLKATIADDRRSVVIAAERPVQAGVPCTLNVSGVTSMSGERTVVPASFTCSYLPYGAAHYVPEASRYRKVYGFTFPDSCGFASAPPKYDFDCHDQIGRFTRVAYYIELQRSNEQMQYAWISMDAFTDDAGRIAIPTKFALSNPQEIIQQSVQNMRVWSNVDGVKGDGSIRAGNLEFWPYSYYGTPKLGFEGATGNYDFDDSCNLSGSFACMQIHDTENRVPIFCFNNWGGGGAYYDLGLGARPDSANVDWTQSGSAPGWNQRRLLEIYVLEDVEDATVPGVTSVTLAESRCEITVAFDAPILDEGNLAAKVALSDGTDVTAVRLADSRTLVVSVPFLRKVSGLSLILDGFHGATPAHPAIPRTSLSVPGEDVSPQYLPAPEEVVARVPEASEYAYVFKINLDANMCVNLAEEGYGYVNTIDTNGYKNCHLVNNREQSPEYFSRVGYLLELTNADDSVQWVWTAFDAFSNDYGDIDIPTADTNFMNGGHINGRYVSNLDVDSNVDGIVTGRGITTGVIEFSPWDYGTANARGVPGADDGKLDFGDNLYVRVGSYGCMQVGNYAAEQIIWSLTKFNGRGLGIGIGNSSNTGHPDYSFDWNAGNYKARTLYVLVKPDYNPDTSTDYEPLHAVASADGTRLAVSFRSPVRDTAAQKRYYALVGLTNEIVSAEVSAIDPRDVILTLDEPLPRNGTYAVMTLFLKSVNQTLTFETARDVPESIREGVEDFSDWVLVNDLTVSRDANNNYVYYGRDGADYRTDESRFGLDRKFVRIAYSLELKTRGVDDYQWAWAAMDAFTDDLSKIGVPSITRRNQFQTFVNNLSVRAGGAATIATGDWEMGNIEFTPDNYGSENILNVPNATDGAFDWGDRLYGSPDNAGHGCMQIHNCLASDMVIGITKLNGQVPGVLIGMLRNPDGSIADDGTWTYNAGNYETRELRIFVKLAPEPPPIVGSRGVGVEFVLQPQDTLVKLVQGEGPQPFTLNAYAPQAMRYQWRRNGVDIPGATGPVLSLIASEPSVDAYTVVAFIDDNNYATSREAVVRAVPLAMTIILR